MSPFSYATKPKQGHAFRDKVHAYCHGGCEGYYLMTRRDDQRTGFNMRIDDSKWEAWAVPPPWKQTGQREFP